jgi:hypothetical protein
MNSTGKTPHSAREAGFADAGLTVLREVFRRPALEYYSLARMS